MSDSADDHRWQQMLRLLAPMSSYSMAVDANARWVSTQAERVHQESVGTTIHVEILERLSPTAVVMGWTDATTGRYGDQIWTLRSARHKGVCSLSGEPYRRGAPIYRTNIRRSSAANADQSISAAVITRLESELNGLRTGSA